MSLSDLTPLIPMGIVLVTACALLMFEVFAQGKDRTWAAHLTVVGLALALYMSVRAIGQAPEPLFASSTHAAPLIADSFASLASSVVIAGALVASLISPAYLANAGCAHGEYYALMLMSLIGMMVMTMAADLMTLFLGLEVMSISVYVLTGIRKNDLRSSEAALKYFLMGAFATGFLLYGISLIYGATGSVAFVDIARYVRTGGSGNLLTLGVVLLLIGFSFKVAAVPFHAWAPDVYEGAPTPVTGFMAVGVKAAAFVGLLRVVVVGVGGESGVAIVVPMLSLVAFLTIIIGNVLAVVQRNVKRMLAYSSISHAGYAMIGIVAAAKGEPTAGAAVLFYLSAYTFMTLGAFGVLTFLERQDGEREAERFGAFAGIGFRYPALGAAMALFMIALAGMPLTGGFVGKLYVFGAALRAGETGLVFAGVAGSVISVYYYLRVIVAFYMRDVPDPGPLPEGTRSALITVGVGLSVAGVLILGLFPGRWIELGRIAIQSLGVG